ncbi:hypothetical protein [Amycolatopsis sp. NPDC059657]|uniref:Rv1733c family protein n=1 Tax=Amycolatopsis sp. NPDC059657 TaxID=3346899 RepID=UPI00366F416B
MAWWRKIYCGQNPMARSWDRLESVFLIGAVLVVLLAMPVAAAFGSEVYARQLTVSAEQQASRHPSTAVLLDDASAIQFRVDGSPSHATDNVKARWTTPDSVVREGIVTADAGTLAGQSVPIWLDREGNAVDAPISSGDAAGIGVGAAFAAWLIVGALTAGLFMLARLALNRRRHTAWDREWEAVSKDWTKY